MNNRLGQDGSQQSNPSLFDYTVLKVGPSHRLSLITTLPGLLIASFTFKLNCAAVSLTILFIRFELPVITTKGVSYMAQHSMIISGTSECRIPWRSTLCTSHHPYIRRMCLINITGFTKHNLGIITLGIFFVHD